MYISTHILNSCINSLARMRAIDAGENPDMVSESNLVPNAKPIKEKKTPIFLQSAGNLTPKESDNVLPHGPLDFSANKTKNKPDNTPIFLQKANNSPKREKRDPWSFREPDENLHKGLPSHYSPKLRRKSSRDSKSSKESSDLNFGGYEPTFLPKTSLKIQSKGPIQKIKKSPFDDFDDPFGSNDLTLPWEKKNTTTKNNTNSFLQSNADNTLVFSTDGDDISNIGRGDWTYSQRIRQQNSRGESVVKK